MKAYKINIPNKEVGIKVQEKALSQGYNWPYFESADLRGSVYRAESKHLFLYEDGEMTQMLVRDVGYFNRHPHKEVTWQEYLKEEGMKKSDLVAGHHVVEDAEGSLYQVMDSYLADWDGGWKPLDDYDDSLVCEGDEYFNIVKVYENLPNKNKFRQKDKEYLTLVWERKKEEEMTMEEICKALGKNIKIVKEK